MVRISLLPVDSSRCATGVICRYVGQGELLSSRESSEYVPSDFGDWGRGTWKGGASETSSAFKLLVLKRFPAFVAENSSGKRHGRGSTSSRSSWRREIETSTDAMLQQWHGKGRS